METQLASSIELVLSPALPTRAEIEALCQSALGEQYRSISIPSGAILTAQHFLSDHPVRISCRVGFPLGEIDPDVKRYETELAIDAGAHEIELVPSLARIADHDLSAVLREIRDVAEAADERPLKVAIQPSRWPAALLRQVVQVVLDSGAQYLSTHDPASALEELEILRQLCGPEFGIIAILDDVENAPGLLAAGASIVAISHSLHA